MSKKITEINQKVRSKEFSGKYPRLSRENTELSPDNAPKEMLAYSPESWNIPDYVYATTKNEPIDGFYLLRNNKLLDILPCFNDVLIYRMVKGLYGEPDILGGYISHLEGKPPFLARLIGALRLRYRKTCSLKSEVFYSHVQPILNSGIRHNQEISKKRNGK